MDKEYDESFPILAQACQMISTLTALKEEIQTEIDSAYKKKLEEQARKDRLRKEEEDRKFLQEERQRSRMRTKRIENYLLRNVHERLVLRMKNKRERLGLRRTTDAARTSKLKRNLIANMPWL